MNKVYVWIGAAILAVGPLALLATIRPAVSAGSTPVSAYVLMDGPVAASTDEVMVRPAGEAMMTTGNSSGSVGTSVAWTAAAAALVLAAWGAVALGDVAMSRGKRVSGIGGRERAGRRGWAWRFAGLGVARWGSVRAERIAG